MIDVTISQKKEHPLNTVPFGSAFQYAGDVFLLPSSNQNRARAGNMQAIRFMAGRAPEERLLDSKTPVTPISSSIEFTRE